MRPTEAGHYAALIAGRHADYQQRQGAAIRLLVEVAATLNNLGTGRVGARSADHDGGYYIHIRKGRQLGLHVDEKTARPLLSRPEMDGQHIVGWGDEILVTLVFDGSDWISMEPDTYLAPEPGRPIPRRTAVAVILEALYREVVDE